MSAIDTGPFIHPLAFVCGDVTLGPRVSVWPFAVIRGDTAPIAIGESTNVQDATIIHVDRGVPTSIGARVAIGHRAIIHGATVGDDCLIAMGATLLNGVTVGAGSVIGAGAVCAEGMQIPPGSVVLGVPARVVKPVTEEMKARISRTVASYLELQRLHREGRFPPVRNGR